MIAFLVDWGCETNGPRRAVALVDDIGAESLCDLFDTLDDIGCIDAVKFRQIDAGTGPGVYLEIADENYSKVFSFKKKTKWQKLADVYLQPWKSP